MVYTITLYSTNNCDVVPSSNLHDVHLPQESPTVEGGILVGMPEVLRSRVQALQNLRGKIIILDKKCKSC